MKKIHLEYQKIEKECKALQDELLREYSDVFTDSLQPGDKCNVDPVRIELKENTNVKPVNVKSPRDVPIQIRAAADKEIKTLLEAGVIAESKTPTDYCAHGMFIKKKITDGSTKVRLVADFKGLNRILKRPEYPNEASFNLLKRIPPQARVFAVVDWCSGYYQIEIQEQFRELFSFVVSQGKFHFCRLPQ